MSPVKKFIGFPELWHHYHHDSVPWRMTVKLPQSPKSKEGQQKWITKVSWLWVSAALALLALPFGCSQVGESQSNTSICRSPALFWPPCSAERVANYSPWALLLCHIAWWRAHSKSNIPYKIACQGATNCHKINISLVSFQCLISRGIIEVCKNKTFGYLGFVNLSRSDFKMYALFSTRSYKWVPV